MGKSKLNTILVFLFLVVFSMASASPQKGPPLTNEQQSKFLARRLPNGAVIGTFGAFGSLLYAALDIAIHTNDKEIGDTELHSPFPEFYKPTVREMLDAIALQTKSSWSYSSQDDYWVFAKPAVPKPLSITLADKWIAIDRGIYVGYKPPTSPVGMDIYYYGTYSSDDPSQQAVLWERIRNSWAIGFASHFKPDVAVTEMRKVTVDGVEALYFQIPTPRPGVVWRQWALVKNGHAFVIVSTLLADDKKSLSDVESMVKTFRVVS